MEYIKIEDGYGRRYDVLHAYSEKARQTFCGIVLTRFFVCGNTRAWYVTSNPFGHAQCGHNQCRKNIAKGINEYRQHARAERIGSHTDWTLPLEQSAAILQNRTSPRKEYAPVLSPIEYAVDEALNREIDASGLDPRDHDNWIHHPAADGNKPYKRWKHLK